MNKFQTFFWCFHCWLWTSKCLLGIQYNILCIIVLVRYSNLEHIFRCGTDVLITSTYNPYGLINCEKFHSSSKCHAKVDITQVCYNITVLLKTSLVVPNKSNYQNIKHQSHQKSNMLVISNVLKYNVLFCRLWCLILTSLTSLV